MSKICWENYFAQPIMKVIDKRKPFKTNNSGGVQYGLHISNAPSTGGGRDVVNAFGEGNCTAIVVIHNCAE